MSDLTNPNPAPQFSIAEFGTSANADTCKMCQKPITGAYYRANGAMVCDSCADRVRRGIPRDSHAAFVKAILFGLGGFAAGLIAYAGFTIVTGIQIGYFSLAVGWMVGKAMMIGSGNIGGRRYQIAAVVLTYAAVSMAAIPIAFLYHPGSEHKQATKQTTSNATSSPSATEDAKPSDEASSTPQNENATRSPIATLFMALGQLALIGLASPFLELAEGLGGLIGLVILFVGMRFAWRMTAAKVSLAVEGPYQISAPTATGASA